jgi:hypothetical protein
MLFKTKFLELIRDKKVNVAFRRWSKPTVKEGGTLLTAVGQLSIDSLTEINYKAITDKDLVKAGYDTREELDKELSQKEDGTLYRITFTLAQEDPRIRLRQNVAITPEELGELKKKLEQLNARSKHPDWTSKVLQLFDKEPGKQAVYYAAKLGYEKAWFKINVRKLKALGLTISLENGYTISPRGKKVLREM